MVIDNVPEAAFFSVRSSYPLLLLANPPHPMQDFERDLEVRVPSLPSVSCWLQYVLASRSPSVYASPPPSPRPGVPRWPEN